MTAASCLSSVKSAGLSLTKHVAGRADALLSMIDKISDCAGALLPGIVMATTSLAVRKDPSNGALHRLDFAGGILSAPLPHFLNLFSLNAITPETGVKENADFGTRYVRQTANYVLPTLNKKTSFFKAHVLARGGFVVLAVAAIVIRATQAIFNCFAIPRAIISMPFASRETLTHWNAEAASFLEWPKVIGDLFISATGIVNPVQGRDLISSRYEGFTPKVHENIKGGNVLRENQELLKPAEEAN
ncbi:MAG: hypothetical protein Q8L98_02550 [Chlamydiales bacterium]|nr:hypothetical protein [Chlamydiales bacterium]